jgi:hypothetical protein
LWPASFSAVNPWFLCEKTYKKKEKKCIQIIPSIEVGGLKTSEKQSLWKTLDILSILDSNFFKPLIYSKKCMSVFIMCGILAAMLEFCLRADGWSSNTSKSQEIRPLQENSAYNCYSCMPCTVHHANMLHKMMSLLLYSCFPPMN